MKSGFRKISLFDLLFFSWLALVLLAFNNYISLWDQDEAAYAGFAKRMLETGKWVVPDFVWSEIHRKPPLHFWLIALSYKIFGINTFAVRFFSALAVFFSAWLLRFKGPKLFGENVSKLALLFFGGNLFLLFLGKMAVTDALLLLSYTWGGLALADYLLQGRKKGLYIFYLWIAFGLLVKGPPIVLWAGFWWLLLLFFYPEKRRVISLHPWIWGILALLPFGIWLYLAWEQNSGFVRWWIDWYILKRTHSAVLNQTGPPGTYLALFFIFGLAYLPLMVLLFKFIAGNFRSRDKIFRFLLLWLIAGWLPYEFLPSKLPAYVLAAYPAMVLLFGLAWKSLEKGHIQLSVAAAYLQAIVFFILAGGTVFVIFSHIIDLPEGSAGVLIILLGLFLLILILSIIALKKIKVFPARAGRIYLISGLLWTSVLLLILLPKIEPFKNATFRTAKTVGGANHPDKIIVLQHFGHPPSLPFYLEKFNEGKRILYPENPSKYLKDHFNKQDGVVWILSPVQYRKIYRSVNGKYKTVRITAINTGSVGKNDFLILIPND